MSPSLPTPTPAPPSGAAKAPASQPNPAASRASNIAQIVLGVVALGVFESRYPGTIRAIVAFVITLSILVFVHEWGHFQFARWAGMKVNRFAIGFPPFIFNREKNGITYSIGALPIGGMVDIAGLGSEEEMVHTAKGEAPPVRRDTSRPFGQKQYQDASLAWRFMVIFAGPLMNFIFAIVVAVGLFSIVGYPNYERASLNRVDFTMGGSPASKAGLQSGDLIVGVNGVKTTENPKFVKVIQGSNGKPVTLDLLRNGEPVEAKLTPQIKPGDKVATVGIAFDFDPKTLTYERVGIGEATQKAFQVSFNMTSQLFGLLKRAVTWQLTDFDKASIGGPVKIAQKAGQASRDGGLLQSVMMAIGLSMNLGLMNLLPLPALDGGRIMFLGYELVARRPFNPKWEGLVHAAGMLMLLTFMLFITLRDVNAGALLERFTN